MLSEMPAQLWQLTCFQSHIINESAVIYTHQCGHRNMHMDTVKSEGDRFGGVHGNLDVSRTAT